MAFISDNLAMVFNPVGGGIGPRIFVYQTASDSDATITGAGYFAGAVPRGMRVGDLVLAVATTGPKKREYQCTSVSGAAATVSGVTAIT